MIVSLDTSVLVAALTEEEARSDDAARMLRNPETWLISDWAAAEFSAAIRAKARRGELQDSKVALVEASLDALIARLGGAFPIEAGDHRGSRALIIIDGGVRAPDALHIVAAQRVGASLATFDVDQARAARAVGVSVYA
ncbi:MAG: type II toxin-antitoxin system VapC family toxin [Alphaproteobacteria bacterium]|nr:type II toxin-antitoxin system VapC family toxin [Alphaproteobacteria bacterium]MBU2378975.1 type II toxin-antitoxin system VapC family toxin [Alphaproteobacteria bacterium]